LQRLIPEALAEETEMPRLHSLCTAILHVALLLAAAGLAGCFYGDTRRNIDRNPVVDTGVGASVIMPGQSAPAYSHPAPGSAAPAEKGQEGGGAATSGSASGAEPSPTSVPLTMIGRSSIDEERNMSAHEESTWMKYVALPFAVLAAPFKAAAEAVRGEPEPGPPVPNTTPERPQAEQRPAPVDYDTQRLQEMEQELDRTLASPPAPAPPSSSVAGAPPSIADELAALQRLPRTPEPSRQAVPQPAESTLGAKPVQPLRGETDLADGIVDRDGDGRVDMWIYRENGQIARKTLDQNFDGRPDTTLQYDRESHQLARVGEDSDQDGAIDTWTDYRDGRIVRRRADADRDGTVDTWTFYRDGQTTRHEQDTTGDGFRDRVGFYVDGKLVREDLDSNGDGRPNITNYYDAKERVVRREEDTNLDGVIDIISHYEKGHLARRELLSDAGTATR
jgi:hypothetical protein